MTNTKTRKIVTKTCQLCGRVGSRQFSYTTHGWQCDDYDACASRIGDVAAPTAAQQALFDFIAERAERKRYEEHAARARAAGYDVAPFISRAEAHAEIDAMLRDARDQ